MKPGPEGKGVLKSKEVLSPSVILANWFERAWKHQVFQAVKNNDNHGMLNDSGLSGISLVKFSFLAHLIAKSVIPNGNNKNKPIKTLFSSNHHLKHLHKGHYLQWVRQHSPKRREL